MPWLLRLCGCAVLAAAALPTVLPKGADGRRSAVGCESGYAYAGLQVAKVRSGIRATVSTVKAPGVEAGQVAGWMGVGGPGLGPNGSDVWLQMGYVAFRTGQAQIYYETAFPGSPPAYHTVKATLSPNERHLVSILEVGSRHGSWRAWLDNKAVSPPIPLPRSHGRFIPQAIGETWNAGTSLCNRYGYGFDDVRVSAAPGGSWTSAGKAGYRWQDAQNQLDKISSDSFHARSASVYVATAPNEPPLLGALASQLAGRPLTARCVRQGRPIREQPEGRLLLSRHVCETLVGYAVAQPWAPRATTAVGLAVAITAIGYLRGVARAARVDAGSVDCRAVGQFYRALRTLGATPEQALALRLALLRARAKIDPDLHFAAGCPFS
jgi:hypothetical protein